MEYAQDAVADRALGRLARNYALNGPWIGLCCNCDLACYVCGKMRGSCFRLHDENIVATPAGLETGIHNPLQPLLFCICPRSTLLDRRPWRGPRCDGSSEVCWRVQGRVRVKTQVFVVEDRSDLPRI